jgi:hypothetical protein
MLVKLTLENLAQYNIFFSQDVDTALIKMYAKVDPSKLVIYLRNEDILCDVDDCFDHLVKGVELIWLGFKDLGQLL